MLNRRPVLILAVALLTLFSSAAKKESVLHPVGFSYRQLPAPENYNWRGSDEHVLSGIVWYPAETNAGEKDRYIGPPDAPQFDAGRARAAFAAELHAASTVQQLLLQSASCSTPGFQVNSVYLPASEVGGDFFLVSSAPDGSLTAIVGDVSGKGLTAAMRVAMILGALRRETSHDPGEILSGLNNVLIAQGQLGFTTACCVQIAPSGEYGLANAGHIAPYLAGREIATPPALPLGLVPDQTYDLVQGRLAPGEQLVLLSDGVPEARSQTGKLYGFERLPSLTKNSAQEIADAAKQLGQEDDITVLTLALATS